MGSWKIIRPEATTNLAINPSLETGIAGWVAPSSNTIAQSSARAMFGNYSALCTYQDQTKFIRYNFTFPNGNVHRASAWIWVASNWDGGDISLGEDAYASIAVTIIDQWVAGTDATEQWFKIESEYDPAADLVGAFDFDLSSAPTAGREVNIDGFQIEEKTGNSTTFCDGDQPDCKWAGVPHGSKSSRIAISREGGRVIDLNDDLDLWVEQMGGAGFPLVDNISQPRALLDGQEHQRSISRAGSIMLTGKVFGSSLSNYNALRNTIIADVAPSGFNEQPVIFHYMGGGSHPRVVRARYSGGLQMNMRGGFTELVGLQFIIDDANVTRYGNNSAVLDETDTGTFQTIARRKNGLWDVVEAPTGSPSSVRAIVEDDTYIYIGGSFSNWDGIALADNIVRLDKDTGVYTALASGLNGQCRHLAIGADGILYAAGDFTNAGSDAVADSIAQWSGSAWSAVGDPVTGATIVTIRRVEVVTNGDVWVVGDFANLAGIANADDVAYWDGTAWNAAGTGTDDNDCDSLDFDRSTGDVYVGGSFSGMGGVSSTSFIARWDGAAWNALDAGITSGTQIQAIYVDDAGLVYVGGSFTAIGSLTVTSIAVFNGSSWAALGDGVDTTPQEIKRWRDYLVVTKLTGGGNELKLWNGSVWTNLDFVPPGSFTAYGILWATNDVLYIGLSTTGSGSFSGNVTVKPDGNYKKTYPVIKIKRSGGTSANVDFIGNETLKAYLWLDYALLDGETITIDLRPGKQRSMTSSVFGKRWKVLPNSDAAGFYLLPADNVITLFVNTAGSPTITAFIEWKDTYWGID